MRITMIVVLGTRQSNASDRMTACLSTPSEQDHAISRYIITFAPRDGLYIYSLRFVYQCIICMCVYLPVLSCIYVFSHESLRPSVCLSVCLSPPLSLSLSLSLSICGFCLCLSVCLSVWLAGWLAGWLASWLAGWLALSVSVSLCEHAMFVWKFSYITFHSLIHADNIIHIMYINNACNLISTHQ